MSYYPILVHHQLLKLIRQRPPAWREAVQKTLQRLQFGYWDNGTRVKLLKGVTKLVFEARVTLDLRLLFTVVRGTDTSPPFALQPYILAWDLVDHDHLDRARRLNVEPETGFLDFTELLATELDGTPMTPDRLVGLVPRSGNATTPADAPKTADELRTWLNRPAAPPTEDEITESIRWFRLDDDLVTDDAEWQTLLDDPAMLDLELKLSREQAEAVLAPGPVLLKGCAGSGKTTVSVYRLAREVQANPGGRVLYVTYSASLVQTVKQLFFDLYRARRLPLPSRPPDFLTFPELYRRLAGSAAMAVANGTDGSGRGGAGVVRYAAFAAWYRRLQGASASDAALAWEEIRGIIKGACLDPHCTCLTRAEYEDLGRKRAPLFVEQRPRLYKVFEAYTKWLGERQQYDDIDLARRAFRGLRERRNPPYSLVICDEGQDLTELELEVLLHLPTDLHHLLVAADPQQIVNPSGFRWAELRSRLRERVPWAGQTPILRLSRNFRSVHSIVALTNAVIALQRDRTGRSDDDDLQDTPLQGATPVLVSGSETEVLTQVRGFGPRCAVVAATPDDAERLAGQLDSARVFDVSGAKGLEFDACVLWNPLGSDLDLWQRLLETTDSLKEDPVSRRAIRHLYVSLTRARRYLGVYEADPRAAALWANPAWRGLMERDVPEALARFMLKAATPDAWADEGEWFMARERFLQAAECFRRAGRERAMLLANAEHRFQIGEYGDAAAGFREIDEPTRLAPSLELDGQYAAAATVFLRLGQPIDAARDWELANDLPAAADAWHAAHQEDERRRCLRTHYVRTRNWLEAGRIAVKQDDLAAAIDYYQRAGQKPRAVELQRLLDARTAGDDADPVDLPPRVDEDSLPGDR